MTLQYDVGVVGYGACSAVLVNLLAESGLSVVVFEKEADVLAIPRAAHFDDETVRTFQVLGAADDLSASFSTSAAYGIYNSLNQRVWGADQVSNLPTDQGWLSDYFFFQPDFEHYLRDKAAKRGVVAKISCEVTDFAEGAESVLISYKNQNEHPEQVSVKYLVGADGANSFVRKRLGSEMEKLAESQRWLIVDIRLHDGVDATLSSDCWTKVDKDETITFVPMPNNMKRFEYALADDQNEADVCSDEAVAQFLARWFERGSYDVLRANVYHFHSQVAKSWRQGRVFLAGDAAHLTPPFLGQGVCTAIRDAMNLAWKLARVLKGESPAALLDTYETERRPHAYTFVYIAGKVGEKIRWLASATPEELAAAAKEEYSGVRPPLGAGLHNPQARGAGMLGPQPRLTDGRLMDYQIGYNFALVGDPTLIASLQPAANALLDKMQVVRVPDSGAGMETPLTALGGGAMLIRPDHYMVGVAQDTDELNALVTGLAGHLLEAE